MLDETTTTSRRGFLKGSASLGLGLVLGLRLGEGVAEAADAGAAAFAPNAFLRIGTDGTVTVLSKHVEMGQGSYTGLATIVAEELDAAWSTVRVEAAPADATRYANLAWGIQGTGGSSAIANSYEQLRQAGATARAMLVEAAARRWGVPARELTVMAGVVRHPRSRRRATFGELATAAAGLEVPEDARPKATSEHRLTGRPRRRVDAAAKARGTATFGIDVQLPGMRTAMIARPPRFGAKLASFDAAAAEKVAGVVKVVEVPQGVAVVATNTWAARKGREALRVTWDEADAEPRSSADIMADYRQLAATPGKAVFSEGDAAAALGEAKVVLEATYEFPYLAHAPMEPLNAAIHVTKDGAEVWAGSQLQTVDQGAVARVLGLPPAKVHVHTTYAGGSFGRRATPVADIFTEVASVAKALGDGEPVRVVWTREDDITGGRYRPCSVQKVRVGIGADGQLSGWEHRLVSQSILAGTPFQGMIQNHIDPTSIEGASEVPYHLGPRQVELHTPRSPVTILWWRSVGHTTTGYSMETMLDEVAEALHEDPVALRLRLLHEGARERAVLERAAREAGWGRQLPPGRAQGVAVVKSFGSYVAQVAEVSVGEEGAPRVHRVTCAVDCSRVLNPDMVAAQIESGVGYGLGAVLFNQVPIVNGAAGVKNFDEYRPLRIHEMPEVDVHILDSDEKPTGVGEPGVPPVGPAVANAWFRLTGTRVRRLPFLGMRA